MTVEELIVALKQNNGFVIRQSEAGQMRVQYTALLPAKRNLSPMMFQALTRRNVLNLVTTVTKAGVTTQTYRIV